MKHSVWYSVLLLCAGFTLAQPNLFQWPKHFPAPVYDFKKNPLNAEKIKLGHQLFYDPVLSADSTISCASCHSPFNAFAHTDHDLSHGINDQIGTRNAPALFNLAWQKEMMWDGAIHHLDVQALAPIANPVEMNESIKHVVEKLQRMKNYRHMFYRAFNDSLITGQHVLQALAQFQLTLVSANSKYDQVKQKKARFSQQENRGYTLFKQHCNVCHREPLFTRPGFENNGLPVDTTLNDVGRIKVTQLKEDSLLFKIPSLRNLKFTFPYMHDGRFKTLNQVLNHYTNGITAHATLSKSLKKPIQLTDVEKKDLIAFLLTLNDLDFVFNKEIGFPKKN